MRTPESPKTLYDKIFDEHVVRMEEDGTATLYIDRHLVHEVIMLHECNIPFC